MKPTKFNKMVIDQESATFAVFTTRLLNIKFSDFVPEKFVVYTFDPESENSQVEETLLVQFDEKTGSGLLIDTKGKIIKFEYDFYILNTLEEAEEILKLHKHNQKVIADLFAFEENFYAKENIRNEEPLDALIWKKLDENKEPLDDFTYNWIQLIDELVSVSLELADEIIKKIDELLDVAEDISDIIDLSVLRDIICNEKETILNLKY